MNPIAQLHNYDIRRDRIMMRTHSMTDISDRVERLKQDFLNPDTPNEKKAKIIEYFKQYNELFVSDIDIDAFFRQLLDLENEE